jgi:hypothetical protein
MAKSLGRDRNDHSNRISNPIQPNPAESNPMNESNPIQSNPIQPTHPTQPNPIVNLVLHRIPNEIEIEETEIENMDGWMDGWMDGSGSRGRVCGFSIPVAC